MKYLNQFLIILGFALIGEVLQRVVPLPIPASVYGIALLFSALCFGLLKVEQVKEAGGFLSSLLPVLFVAPTVALMDYWDVVRPVLIPFVAISFVVTIAVVAASGLVTQWLIRKGEQKDA